MAERKYQFERLTPIDNMDLDVYEEAIDYVFDNSDIKNVAISGAYSAGKSSVLASYKKNHSNLRFLHISLAHFKSPDQEDETEIKESVLEGKILNQLIHQIPSEKIPQTNFRVKKKVNTKSVIRLTIGAVLFLVSTIYFFCFDMWKNYLSSLPDNWFKTILTPSTHQYALMVDGVLMVALLSFVVYRLISVQKNKNIFRKLNLNGNEIEIFEESDDSYFDKYLNQNINKYFDVILKISNGTICDEENVAVAVLNDTNLTTERKQHYISGLRTTITFIKEISDSSLWSSLLDADLVQYSECNIMECFNAISINESVISYINRSDTDLDFSKTEYDEKAKGKLFDSVVICNNLDNSKYKQILVSLPFIYDQFDIAEIPDDKIAILIDTDIIRMTADNLKFMRENYPNRKDYFIGKNIEKYVEIMDDDLFSRDELLAILTWQISDALKITLLGFTDEEISIIGKNYSPTVCLHILSSNFAESDLHDLFSSFEQWDSSVQTKIFDYAVRYIARIIDDPNSASQKLKNNLLDSESVNRDEKIDLFIAMMPSLCENSIKEFLTLLNLTDYLKIFDTRSRPKFEINDENEKLLAAFKEANMIDNYEESSEKEGYYKITRPKPAAKTLPKELL